MSNDPVNDLAHDHLELNRRVIALGGAIAASRGDHAATLLEELRDHLFDHFAREEEGLFPFVSEALPDLDDEVREMAIAHDMICGTLARMLHLAASGAALSLVAELFGRFETAYARHADREATLLRALAQRLDADQRVSLAIVVRGL
jgi:iron-sulfur cluster repair protein YtfE (RIC family)